ncbi:MAG: succinate dehydrogenase, cytochrome b556 subunit [Phototrophicales bacterium]|nr:succinate dehydrogenase, cytochrome b556 subunit [Phototrophicales bacterium]
MSSLVTTLTETLRYRGAIGQWSWVLHRITGLGVLFFFILHIIDTSWSVFYPELYEKAIAIYQTPLFTLGEFALVAAVVYHAFNGLRIGILDYNPRWWRFQQRAAIWVVALSLVVCIPVFLLMLSHVLKYYGESPQTLGLAEVLVEQLPFVVGIGAGIVAAFVFAVIVGLVVGNKEPAVAGGKGKGSKLERFWWSYMRMSGLLIVPLVFGHLAIMHVVQGVFDLTVVGAPVAGVTATVTELAPGEYFGNAINDSGTAVEFVGERWNYLVASVAIWRFYDFALLFLAAVHGFNGLRYVLTDYTSNSVLLRRTATYVCIIGASVIVVVGGAALAGTIDSTSVKMAEKARIALFEEEGEHSTSETEGTVAPVETDTEEPVTTNTETETETPDN